MKEYIKERIFQNFQSSYQQINFDKNDKKIIFSFFDEVDLTDYMSIKRMSMIITQYLKNKPKYYGTNSLNLRIICMSFGFPNSTELKQYLENNQ